MNSPSAPYPSTQRTENGWYRGVLRDAKGKIVWVSLAIRHNRDCGTYTNGPAAYGDALAMYRHLYGGAQ